jgi:hypothetical protein
LRLSSTTGESTVPLTISASKYALRYPYTAIISADFSFPSQGFYGNRKVVIPTENVTTQSTLIITIGNYPNVNPISVQIPQEYLIGFYGIILSLILPAAGRWVNTQRQRKYITKYMLEIDLESNKLYKNKVEGLENLKHIQHRVSMAFATGKINDSNYKILNDRIRECEDKLKF